MGCSASVPQSGVVSRLPPDSLKDTVPEDGRRSADSAASTPLCWSEDSVSAEKKSSIVATEVSMAANRRRTASETTDSSGRSRAETKSARGRRHDSDKAWKHFWRRHEEGHEESCSTKHGVHFSASLNLRTEEGSASAAPGKYFSSSPSISLGRASSIRNNLSRDSNAVQRARTRNSYNLASLPSYAQKPFEPEHGGLAPPPPESSPGFEMLDSLVELGEHGLHGLRPTVRLLKAESVLRMPQLMSYAHISSSCYVEMPYVETTDEVWAATLVVSWRWHRRLPPNADSGFTPMSPEQLALLKDILCDEGAALQFVWVDFACCPQPGGKQQQLHMTEVMRSKLYYARAARMLALPSIVVLPNENSVSGMLHAASSYLQSGQQLPARKVQIVRTVLHKLQGAAGLQISKRDYFCRAWTLAERLSRAGRGERLQHWMPLTSWMGVLLDLLWVGTQPAGRRKVEAFPWAQLHPQHGPTVRDKLSAVADLYDASAHPKLPPYLVPTLLLEGLELWAAPLPDVDILSPAWLASYLTAEANVLYVATDWRDTLQAVFSFYATDPKAATDPEAAASVLCAFAGVSVQQTQLFKQGLLSGTAASGLRVSMDVTPGGSKEVQFTGAPLALRAALKAVGMGEQARSFEWLESCLASRAPGPLSDEQAESLRVMTVEVQETMRSDVGSPRIQSAALRALELVLAAMGDSYATVAGGLGVTGEVVAAMDEHPGLDQVVGSAARVLLVLCTAHGSSVGDVAPILLTLRRVLAANPSAPALQEVLCTCCLHLLHPPPPPEACNWLKLAGDITTAMCAHRRQLSLQLLCCRLFRTIVRLPLSGPYERDVLLDGLGRIGALTDLAISMEAHVGEPSLQVEAMGCLQVLLGTAKNREKAGDLGILSVVVQVLQRNQEAAELAAGGAEVLIAAAPHPTILEQAAALRVLPLLAKKLARWLTRPDVLAPLTRAVAKLSMHQGMRGQGKAAGVVATLQSIIHAHPENDVLGNHARDAIANIIAL